MKNFLLIVSIVCCLPVMNIKAGERVNLSDKMKFFFEKLQINRKFLIYEQFYTRRLLFFISAPIRYTFNTIY